jgi:hypothetical protein
MLILESLTSTKQSELNGRTAILLKAKFAHINYWEVLLLNLHLQIAFEFLMQTALIPSCIQTYNSLFLLPGRPLCLEW